MHLLILTILSVYIAFGTCGERRELPPFGKPMRKEFFIRQNFSYLNQGSFGTFPRVMLKALNEIHQLSEQHPDLWIRKEFMDRHKISRQLLGEIMNVDADDVVFLLNVSSAINAILRNIIFATGDRILYFSTLFKGVKRLIQYLIDRHNGQISGLVFNLTYPITNELYLENLKKFLEENYDPAQPIRIAVIEHITSVPAVINPIDKIIPLLKSYNIPVLVDAAHSIGHIPIDLKALDPEYYVTDAHKWLYLIRGFAVMYVKKSLQAYTHPLSISEKYNSLNDSNFQMAFYYSGTIDFTPYVLVPEAMDFIRDAGGLEKIMKYNHELVMAGGRKIAEMLGTELLTTEDQIGNMVDVRVPIKKPPSESLNTESFNEMQYYNHTRSFVKIHNHNGQWFVRVSAQIFLDLEDFVVGAEHVKALCDEVNKSR